MNEAQLFEVLGRKQAALENLDANYTRLLELLAAVVSGSVEPSRLMVNLTERTWTMAPPGQRPPAPATINGRPLCVVAPNPEPEPARDEARDAPDA